MNTPNQYRRRLFSGAAITAFAVSPTIASDGVGGLPLPLGVVQPFEFRFAADDLHAMLFFKGHPSFEAIEVMIKRRSETSLQLRVILTRHDQTQIDHVNTETMMQAAAATQRETVIREIRCTDVVLDGKQGVKVELNSFMTEPIRFQVVCAGAPDAARGGLTDPGDHAKYSSFPVMLRGKSAQAGKSSEVIINGVQYEIPILVDARPHYLGLHGYYTESHRMAIIRAGVVSYDLIESPTHFSKGQRWVLEQRAIRKIYTIESVNNAGMISITCEGLISERVICRIRSGQLMLMQVTVFDPITEDFASLDFESLTGFRVRFSNTVDLVIGTYETRQTDEQTTYLLAPVIPQWASQRAITAHINSSGGGLRLSIETKLGRSWD